METERRSSSCESESKSFAPDDKVASLFQPDTLLSAQFIDNLRRRTILDPEKRLMLAILEDGIQCYRDNLNASRGKKKRDFDEAAAWIVDTEGDWVFSFENVCDALGLSPEYLRQGLLRWRDSSRKSPPHSTHAAAENWPENCRRQNGTAQASVGGWPEGTWFQARLRYLRSLERETTGV
jgi:hypothetical protein